MTLTGPTPARDADSKPTRDPGRRHARGYGPAQIIAAGTWLCLSAFVNLVYGFGALGSQRIAHASYMFGILHSSGWIAILVDILQYVVAVAAMMGNQLGRWWGHLAVKMSGYPPFGGVS